MGLEVAKPNLTGGHKAMAGTHKKGLGNNSRKGR
jgi:hypothetical protein